MHQADVVSSEDSETYNLKHIVDAPANIDDPQVGCYIKNYRKQAIAERILVHSTDTDFSSNSLTCTTKRFFIFLSWNTFSLVSLYLFREEYLQSRWNKGELFIEIIY